MMVEPTIRKFQDAPHLEPSRTWNIGSAAAILCAVLVSALALLTPRDGVIRGILFLAVSLLVVMAAVHFRFLHFAKKQYLQSNGLAKIKAQEFHSIFENALDAIVVLDRKGVCLDANPSALELFGAHRDKMIGQPVRLFYSDSQDFDSMWSQLLINHRRQGEAELTRPDGTSVVAEFTAAAYVLPHRHLVVFRDVTHRRRAQEAVNGSLILARSALKEAEALRRATLALTEDLRMSRVLDTLLATLAELVPYEIAQVLLLEADSRLFVAGEAPAGAKVTEGLGFPETLELADFPILARVLPHQDGLLFEDVLHVRDWRASGKRPLVRSWMGVPIVSAGQVVGILSLAHSRPDQFSAAHLRLTRSLAASASVAIRNARLYERAEIYGSELEHRIAELNRVHLTLEEFELGRQASEDRFQKLFRAAPVAISVTTLAEGRFVEVNEAFVHRFGFTRNELLGRTSTELGFWENPQERTNLIEQIRTGRKVSDAVARLRIKAGSYQPSLCSAELIDLDDQPCLLVTTEDLPNCPPGASS